jgi:hypothetical protein
VSGSSISDAELEALASGVAPEAIAGGDVVSDDPAQAGTGMEAVDAPVADAADDPAGAGIGAEAVESADGPDRVAPETGPDASEGGSSDSSEDPDAGG